MNDKIKFPFWDVARMNHDWIDSQADWFQNQNQYMDAWSSFQQHLPNSSSGILPMLEAMNSWWRQASPALSGQNHDFYSKIIKQGQAFYFMGEQFNKILEGINDVSKKSEDWQKVLNDNFDLMKSALEDANTSMQGVFTNPSFMSGESCDEQFKIADTAAFFEKLLSIPGFGPERKTLAQTQKGIKLLNEYHKVASEHQAQINKAGVEALETMRLRILKMAEQDKKINSLREIYDMWVDCNETAYAKLVHTDKYSKLYGCLTNSLLAVKQHQGKVMGEFLEKLDIPTRQGIDAALKRIQEMKRTQLEYAARITALEDEIKDLRQLTKGKRKSSVSVTPRSAKVARKKPKNKVRKKISKKTTKKSSAKKAIVIDI